MQKQFPKGYVLIHNISKKHNIGSIIRTACAFGFEKIFYISNRPDNSKKMKVMKQFHCFGNQGTYNKMEFQAFRNLSEAKNYLNENKIKICGVEIGDNSKAVQEHPFLGNTAFFLGNEGSGILPVHREICDYFVYIPQYSEKTASLNVSVAAGIVFHHFAVWAKFPQAKVYGEKYQHQDEPIGQPKKKNEIIDNQELSNEEQEENKQKKLGMLDDKFKEVLPFHDQPDK